jgi:hypothetical protein
MNAKQAKAEPLHEFLGHMGYQPTHIRGNDVWYRSPFRPEERTPSFKVDRVKNVWFDHGLGQGGTIIDFVQQLNQTNDISRVLTTIAGVVGSSAASPIILPPVQPILQSHPPIIESLGIITDRALSEYVVSRGISLDLARQYLKEVAYQVEGNHYKALAFANDAGGFEVRSPNFKGTLGHKDITYLAKNGSRDVAVFEGFFDFLSILSYYQREHSQANVLVMNSVAFVERAIERFDIEGIQKIYAYLDQDRAGRAALDSLIARGDWEIVNGSLLYLGHKDANAFLLAQ